MGSDESHFYVSLTVRDTVTRQCPQTTTSEDKGEPKRIRAEVPLLTSLTPYPWAKPARIISPDWHTKFTVHLESVVASISLQQELNVVIFVPISRSPSLTLQTPVSYTHLTLPTRSTV